MRRIFCTAMTLIIAAFFAACDPAANTGNKPANMTANNANAAAPVNTAAVDADIKKLVADMGTALTKGDVAHFEKLYSDNYMFVGPDGTVSTGQQRVASMKTGDTKYESVAYDEVVVRTNTDGSGAVSISRATVKGKNMGKLVDGQFRATHVWTKTKDGWRLASGQTTPMTTATATTANTAKTADKPKIAQKQMPNDAAASDVAVDDVKPSAPKR